MPDNILELVSVGVDIAREIEKNPRRDVVQVEDLPENSEAYDDLSNDIFSALGKGEKYLSEKQARERRLAIKNAQQNANN